MKRHFPVILFLGVLACARPAGAAYVTAGDLLTLCRSPDEKDRFGCMAHIAGIVDYHVMMQSLGTEPASADFCLPDDLPLDKVAAAVTDELAASPQSGSFIAAPAVLLALSKAYPCAAPKPRPVKKKKGK